MELNDITRRYFEDVRFAALKLREERATLVDAQKRIDEIDAQLASYDAEVLDLAGKVKAAAANETRSVEAIAREGLFAPPPEREYVEPVAVEEPPEEVKPLDPPIIDGKVRE